VKEGVLVILYLAHSFLYFTLASRVDIAKGKQ
jgi:hypothetical protein